MLGTIITESNICLTCPMVYSFTVFIRI